MFELTNKIELFFANQNFFLWVDIVYCKQSNTKYVPYAEVVDALDFKPS